MEIIDRIGLDHSRVVIDHADETIIEYVLRETGAYLGIGVGLTQRHTDPKFFAGQFSTYPSASPDNRLGCGIQPGDPYPLPVEHLA